MPGKVCKTPGAKRGHPATLEPLGGLSLAGCMVRKRPTHEFRASVGAAAGSWDNYRAPVDLGGPLNASGSVRGRIVAAAADGKDFREGVSAAARFQARPVPLGSALQCHAQRAR